MFRKVPFQPELQASRIRCPNELITKFLKGALKLTENFQEMISNGVPYQEFIDPQVAALGLGCF